MKKRPLFTKEFKLEAVRLVERGDKPAADLARELGIRRNQLYKWKDQLQVKGEEQVFLATAAALAAQNGGKLRQPRFQEIC